MDDKSKRGSFSGQLGFVLASAGSAVGLGNIWRFPYLAARDGGGLFLLLYLILVLTFGFTLLTTEIAIGRKTRQGPLTAYGHIKKNWGWIGIGACLVPALILPYYCAIGGWVLKYLFVYLTGQGHAAAQDGFFSAYITGRVEPIIWMVIYFLITSGVVYAGVEKGIEKTSTILMPILFILITGIAIFSLTLKKEDPSGTVRTGLQGLMIYVIPSTEGLTLHSFFIILMDALGQLFYSISVAMGIMITYGSYAKKETNLVKSVSQIELFDTLVAFLAGLMIIPAVYTFMGTEGMSSSGPGLMFISLPKVFEAMGWIGRILGLVFFLMVSFAALTSSVSMMEALVSSFMDYKKISRRKSVEFVSALTLILGLVVCMGYNKLYFELTLPNGVTGQVLDLLDYVSNNILMPVVAIGTCLLIGWSVGPDLIINEVSQDGKYRFGRRKLYVATIRYFAPALLFFLLLQALGLF